MLRLTILLISLAAFAPLQSRAASAAFAEQFSERWYGAASRDAITDDSVLVIRTTSMRVNGRIGFDSARVKLTCNGGKATIGFEWSFKVAGSAGLAFAFRFAGQPGRQLKVRYVNRAEQETKDEGAIRQFLADAMRSEAFIIRINSDLYGVSTADFRPKAGRDAAMKFAAACPAVAPP